LPVLASPVELARMHQQPLANQRARTVAHTPEKARPLASKLKRIYAPRLISDHIMVQEDFERLHNPA
jgi:hypothetical protein